MRLIDADALLELLKDPERYGYLDTIDIINAPTIDPVIGCRDCDVPHNKWTGCPKLNGLVPPDNFYCAFGKKVGE